MEEKELGFEDVIIELDWISTTAHKYDF